MMELTAQPRLKPWQHWALDLRLALRDVDKDALAAAAERVAAQGIRITTLTRELERDPRSARRVYELHRECFALQPPPEVERAPIPYHLWEWAALAAAESLPEAYFIAEEGERYVGLSATARPRRLPGVLECRFTGVLPSHASRGIGQALKASVIAYALLHGYGELRSTVLAENTAMLRINAALGFRTHRRFVQSYALLPKSAAGA